MAYLDSLVIGSVKPGFGLTDCARGPCQRRQCMASNPA